MRAVLLCAVVLAVCLGANESEAPAIERLIAANIDTGDLANVAPEAIAAIAEALPGPGRRVGLFRLTYYWVTDDPIDLAANSTILNSKCRPLARVSRRFAQRLEMEGTGRLRDGRVVNTTGPCSCKRSCYRLTEDAPWGVGVKNRPLSPYRSIAVDPKFIKLGKWLYIPELDGIAMPGESPWGNFVHDGCVQATDVGGSIRGNQVDFFVAQRDSFLALLNAHKQKLRRVEVFDGLARCAKVLEPQVASL